jgi:hypothetical protein
VGERWGKQKIFCILYLERTGGGGGRKGRFKKQFKRGKTIEKVYRKKGVNPPPHPPPSKNVIQKTWLSKKFIVHLCPTLEGNYNGISLGEVFI